VADDDDVPSWVVVVSGFGCAWGGLMEERFFIIIVELLPLLEEASNLCCVWF